MRRRPLYALYAADSISLVGNAIAQLAIPWYVLVTTGSPIPAGILLGGVLVDAVGVSATLFGIGVCHVAVTVFGFFNPAFREMDRRSEEGSGPESAESGSG